MKCGGIPLSAPGVRSFPDFFRIVSIVSSFCSIRVNFLFMVMTAER